MLSKIYYSLGIGIIGLYLLTNLLSLRTGGTPQARSFGVLRMEKGKYVVPTYSSSNSSSSSSSSDGRYRSYPSGGGGYSGGK